MENAVNFLATKIPDQIVKDILTMIAKDLKINIAQFMKEYQYSPRDPPFKRRGIMARTVPVNNDTLLRFITFVTLRGGNPVRSMKNLEEYPRETIAGVMNTMKVKGFVRAGGLFSTWQWLTSYWDYLIAASLAHPTLIDHFFKVGDYVFESPLPRQCFLIGALHLFRGISADDAVALKNEIFRHIHFLIYTKNSLDARKRQNNIDKDEYRAQRLTQANYMDYQMQDTDTNFPQKQIEEVRQLMTTTLPALIKAIPKHEFDFINRPFEAPESSFMKKTGV